MLQYSSFCLILVASITRYFLGINGEVSCDSPQYLEIGKTGSIECSFDENFYGVLWYDATDSGFNYPFCEYQNFVKQGPGCTSGEFDVDANGSLIITNVSLEHEHAFKVAYIRYKDDIPVFIDIAIHIIVKPLVPYPVFDHCVNISNVCFTSALKSTLRCSVDLARPAIPLKLVSRTINGDREISGNTTITPEGDGVRYTSQIVITDLFKSSPDFVLLVCKATAQSGILKKDESFLLVQNGDISISSKDVAAKYITRDSRVVLNCVDTDTGFIVWKKADSAEFRNSTVLLYSINIGEQVFETFADDVTLEDNASLVFSGAKVKNSGFYFCLFGDGVKESLIAYELIVIVNPVPAHPIINGCNHEQYCALEAEHEGTLTCTIKGILPQVKLEWQTFRRKDAQAISFFNDHVTVKENGETFDVTLTSAYVWNDESRDSLTVECMVPSSNDVTFHLSTKIDLLLVKENFKPTDQEGLQRTPSMLLWIIPTTAVIILTVCGIVVIRYTRKINGSETKSANKEEITTLLPMKCYDEKTIYDLKVKFLNQSKAKYKDWYDAVQPIPYIKDRLYCVDKVFVEGGIEFLDSVEGQGGRGVWKTLESYKNVFNAFHVKSPRRILEGEPGYGKSTVTLQFAHDWCNHETESALKDVEILILLRLRQLGGVPSIYKAIKQFILPRDTAMSETDIEQVLRNSKSVVVILDGFDEYPDQDSTTVTDVMAIIARQMFQDFEVVTTTRSSFLPKKYPPLTKRIRLTGFDDKARRYYIRKAVVGDDDEGVRKIERYLEDNPILTDLCQVPLLFVIFAHMTYESEQFRKLNSVTSFFRYMISCFHSHMRNKMVDENVLKYELFETDHRNLDKLAFEAFSGQSQRIVWKKEEMCQLVGQEFYDQYIRIGILVEEESVGIIDDPGTPITEHVQYKTEVRFYHKLFCEWYAAHYLTDYLKRNPSVDLSGFLRYLDPFDVQYLYRFACGIHSKSAERIIDYLKNIEGGDKFAILCILEQTGKIDNIKETIRQLCDEGVVISGNDTLLLQRSSMQLLEIAARNAIPVHSVQLLNCLQSVELSTPSIKTTSGLALTSRIPVKGLAVGLYDRDMTEDEAIDILQFASMCPSLEVLGFGSSVPPQSFKVDSSLATLKSRNVRVGWQMFKDDPWYILNLVTGRWENKEDGEEATSDEFEKKRTKFSRDLKRQQDLPKKAEDRIKRNLERIRHDLRGGRRTTEE